ncbi:isoprenylcysteine carboxylmethyltransferase family protein [Roseomonas sp. PWR1]|uniref:Isoprenylcysteine carboxylmethyltransferase family protein n=1 Tax=Roseomonas nitratireducens TaxID=2820810 RepID=A0ABS4ASW9_9PROT|nr:isoprenylcysteine carboxylmethyltransferase family protein [Neoroseomonas nitratireducens]MBP0464449.1 isoprenylcysteine carboxylmethyltransferase family protein [Neoroseomonas nitratireducens]
MAEEHGPGVRIPPPVLVGGILVAAWVLHRFVPVPLGPPLAEFGALVIFGAFALIGWALLLLVRAGNDPRPDRPDEAMVESGPFRFSRNPIYLGLLLALAGFALRWGDLWGWIAVVAAHLALDRLVVAKEEAYLAARFGDAYAAYRGRVRRWV